MQSKNRNISEVLVLSIFVNVKWTLSAFVSSALCSGKALFQEFRELHSPKWPGLDLYLLIQLQDQAAGGNAPEHVQNATFLHLPVCCSFIHRQGISSRDEGTVEDLNLQVLLAQEVRGFSSQSILPDK